ncbi:hypothetical protein BDP81DRAFT_413993 [Colletotrichum phormii]|uniref:Secreted protein n=1 Tax=Colletotrichum phormii TaxID=359342 RepID=A0AAJ0A6L3_9PEZI|nr:uncharacterized protein BDP81DRAFT_413993 [Colletotrichum phormii]KAK1656021.1 hypothetical protein BDP81DRAFT_413993 [Colletotrichum phormii]
MASIGWFFFSRWSTMVQGISWMGICVGEHSEMVKGVEFGKLFSAGLTALSHAVPCQGPRARQSGVFVSHCCSRKAESDESEM